jgi:D-alanyl-D-alanine carboxypeptidase/D-alanyl-D-alanine-endopeptidase (penicillin-binding protein 4)
MHQNKNIEQFFNDQCVKNAPIGIYVSNYKTNQVLFEYNSEMCLTPASVLKLVTTAAATEILGIQHTFETKIWYSGTIINKTLHGDIIITGGGDPTLGSKYFETQPTQTDFLKTWANAVKQTGIDTITGNIIADPNFYSDHDVPKSWVWEDLGNYYGAAAQGINLYDNTFEITFKTPAGINKKTQIIQVSPPIPNLEIDNRVRTSSDKRDLA